MFSNIFSPIKKVNANKRFTQTEIHPKSQNRFFAEKPPISEEEGFKPIIYKCGKCDFNVLFKIDNFLQGHRKKATNLNHADAKILDDAAKKYHLADMDSLDFYCRNCSMVVRIYYTTSFGGNHGDVFFSIRYVLEMNKDKLKKS